jgi:hypothetical protein
MINTQKTRPHYATERVARKLQDLAGVLDATLSESVPDRAGSAKPLDLEVVGSLRRAYRTPAWARATAHDADLLCVLPGKDQPDPLYERLRDRIGDPAQAGTPLFIGTPTSAFRIEGGLRPGFKTVTITCDLEASTLGVGPAWKSAGTLEMRIHRYTPGAEGNRGWVQMIWTGPEGDDHHPSWSEMMLSRWKRRTGGRTSECFPADHNGRRVPVPTETEAFRLVGLDWIAPSARTSHLARELMGGFGRDFGGHGSPAPVYTAATRWQARQGRQDEP